MPRVLKATWIFEGPGRGFTESYFQQRDDNDLAAAAADMDEVSTLRQVIMGKQFLIRGYRISFVTNDAGQRVRGQSLSTLRNLLGNQAKPAENSDTALLFQWVDASGIKKKYTYLRGIWDSVGTNGGVYNKPPDWVNAIDAWEAKMIAKQFGWWGRTPSQTIYSVDGYTQQAGEQVLLTTTGTPFAGPFPGVKTPVAITGINTRSRLNGTQIVIPQSANSCLTAKPLSVGPFATAGTLRTLDYALVRFTQGEAIRIVSRKAGRPLFTSRGRAPARPRT